MNKINQKKRTFKESAALVLCIIMCCFLLGGCGSGGQQNETETAVTNDASVYGTWTEGTFDSGFTFYADGTGLDIFWDLPFKYTAADGIITVKYDDDTYGTAKYTYTVNESSITMERQSEDGISVTYNKTGDVPAETTVQE